MPATRDLLNPAPPRPGPRPHYRRIYEDIERRVASGELSFGSQLPLLPQLCSYYGVSEAPVRRALDELARAGFIVRQRGRGKGTFIKKRIAPPTLVRVLLIGFDLSRSVIEAYHEIYGILDGVRTAAVAHDCIVQTIGEESLSSLAPVPEGVRLGYLILSQHAVEDAIALTTDAPCIRVNTPAPFAGSLTVSVDMEQGAFLGTDHLARLGHRRIAYIGSTAGGWFTPRYAGYLRALTRSGLSHDETLVHTTSGLSASEDVAALTHLMRLPQPPTAIFACSDYRALHLLNHAQSSLGLSVPRDISLCGYDDISNCTTVSPALTSVYHPLREQGEAAVELLLSALDGTDISKEPPRILAPTLRIRQSSAPPRA